MYQPTLNATFTTAAGPENESYAFTETIGRRSHGSFWAAAVMEALICHEEKNAMQVEQAKPEDPDSIEEKRSTAFAGLTKVIFDTLEQEEYKVAGKPHNARFAAQDDEWGDQWNALTGIPPGHFLARWEELPKVVTSKSTPRNAIVKTGGHLTIKSKGFYGLDPSMSKRQAHLKVKADAQTWLASYPGPFNVYSNMILSKRARAMVEHEDLLDVQIEALSKWLQYRFDLMMLATEYKKVANLDYCDCAEHDFNTWLKEAEGDKKKLAMHNRYYGLLFRARLFPQPMPGQGRKDLKQENYLAAAFVDCGCSEGQSFLPITRGLSRMEPFC